MSSGGGSWWALLLALMALVLPLLFAWWLVLRGVQHVQRKKRRAGDNGLDRTSPTKSS